MADEKVVFTSGTWDMFHIGHLNLIRRSRELGDRLIVAVSTDELVKSYKAMEPIIPYDQRFKIIESLRDVDLVIPQTVLTDIRDLQKYGVNIITIGDDWKGKHLDGLEWAKQNGLEVVYLPYTGGVSTTDILKKIITNAYDIVSAHVSRGVAKLY